MTQLIHERETYEILGASFEVYREKGCGFLEGVYHECLAIEFAARGVPARELVPLPLTYKGRPLKKYYEADFVCFEKVLVEIRRCRSWPTNIVHSSRIIFMPPA